MAFTLSRSKSEELVRAQDPATIGAELVALAASRDSGVKAAVAARSDCPMASMFALAQDSDARVLEALVVNAHVPDSLIVHLAQSNRSQVREAAEERLAQADRSPDAESHHR